jgi:TRAP-type C4-dicarboxylate transport system permease small subunit
MTQSHGSSQASGGPPRRPRTGPMAALTAIDRGIEIFEKYVLSYGVMIMAVVTIANVFGRNVFQQSLYFAEEMNQFLIVLITWVGLGYASRKGRHIRMVPVWLTYIWVPVGFVITGIQYVLAVVRNLREEEVFISYTEVDAYDEGDPTVGQGR